MTLKKAYIFLLFAVIAEVLATSLLKSALNAEYRILGFLGMYALLVLSYYFMALSLNRLSISVAYAIWEVLGGICVALIGIIYFKEILSLQQTLGIILSFCGIACINYAEITQHRKNVKADSTESTSRTGVDSVCIESTHSTSNVRETGSYEKQDANQHINNGANK